MDFKLSIVVPVFNKFNFTKACLEDLFRLPLDHEVIIVDNCSTDDTHAGCTGMAGELGTRATHPHFKYLRNSTNEGFARACNFGFAQSSGKNVMFLNNDIRVQRDYETWTRPIIDFLETKPDHLVGPTVGILSPELNFVKETNEFVGNHWYMGGWNLTSSRDTWNSLVLPGDQGPFSTEFGIAYFEDTDMSFRARKMALGFHIMPVPVTHFGQVTSKSIGLSGLYKPAQEIFKKKWLGK